MSKAAFHMAPIAMALVLFASPALAEPPDGALTSYAAGDFLGAADLAEAQPSSSSLAFAARALMAECLTVSDDAQIEPLLDRAEQAARQALTLDAESVDARLQLAVTLGVRGRRANLAEAISHRYAPRGRRLLEEALERAPDEPWAHALMGGWHLEVIRRGGRAGALAYDASLATGLAEFERARVLAPHDPLIALHYAVALIELDAEAYQTRAAALLEAVAEMQARDAFEAHAQVLSRQLARALERDGPDAADRFARRAFL